jgi:hypothetical protein
VVHLYLCVIGLFMKKGLLILACIFAYSCGVIDKRPSPVYFGGEIVNPTSPYVVLFKDDLVIDSAKLDRSNRFKINFIAESEGLYHFDHSPQFHYVYLEKGDSLNLRLNTLEFDESIVFSGKGEEINNFIVELFLANEEDDRIVDQYFQLEPDVFNEKIESIRHEKLQQLSSLLKEVSLSSRATALINATIDYNAFIYKEKYPFYHKRATHEENLHNIPSKFYSYRKELSLNNKDLIYFRPYYNFMKYHLGNLAYMECKEFCLNSSDTKGAIHFNEHKLKLIDSLIQEKKLKDNLYRNVVMHYLLKVRDTPENTLSFMETFKAYSPVNTHMDEINQLYKDINNLQPNNTIPNLMVQNSDGRSVGLNDISKDKKVIIYFWSAKHENHFKNVQARLNSIASQYPEHTFIGINRGTDYNEWQSMMELYQLNRANQYRSEDYEMLKTSLVIDHMNKSIIIENGRIVNGFADILNLNY